MTRVIHTGDTHLGYRQYHSPSRRQDFLDAFRQVVQDAVADGVDAVVHAGDLYHDRRPGLQDLLGTIDVLEPLREAGIPFLAVVGNHEGTRDAQWLDLFETLDLAERLDSEGRRVGDVVLYGLDYVPESRRSALDYEFTDPADHDADVAHTALVSHGLFTPFPHANWDLDAVLDESTVDFDAVLLGDNHTPDTAQVADTWVTYCGSTERASASEREPRGYNIIEFDDTVSIARRGLDTRDFVFLDVALEPGQGAEDVRDRLREHDLAGAVVIVTIEGDGESVTPAEIEEFGREHDALVTRVNDRRELQSPEADVEASFADPDEAVRERVREMGLSTAARTVDETVRDGAVADTNVRDHVRTAVEDALDDPGAFESVDPDPAEDAATAESSADEPPTPSDPVETDAATNGGDAVETDEFDSRPEADEADSPGEPVEATEANDEGVAGGSEAEADGADAEAAADSDDESAAPRDGANATMEDFL
jgi:DNA repair exonuclease SbcCD nuclease subunit